MAAADTGPVIGPGKYQRVKDRLEYLVAIGDPYGKCSGVREGATA